MAPTEAVDGLVAAFERIAGTRMAGLPLCNPALRVAAVAFRPFTPGTEVGVLVTPWALNLVILSSAQDSSLRLGADCRRTWRFPSGEYDFLGGEEAECGAFQFCSLFSPAFEFRDQANAVGVAEVIVAELFAAPVAEDASALEAARLAGRSAAQIPTTRRGFLQGVFGPLRG